MKKHNHTTSQKGRSTSQKRQRKQSAGVSATHVLKVFIVYLIVGQALAGWINYTSYEVFNPLFMALAALALAVLATAVHVYKGQRNALDDFADDDL